MKTEIKKLNRFTTLPFLIDLLNRKKLTLLNPDSWEDFNDRETMKSYRKKVKAESIYALCLTHEDETIHHWNAFANGTSGCCIEFNPSELIKILDRQDILHRKTEYIKIADLTSEISDSQLPFIKRHPFGPEKEYRIVKTSQETQTPIFEINIELDIIKKITLSGKIPENIFDSIKETLVNLAPHLKNKINHSTLYQNKSWISHFTKNDKN